MSLPSSEISTAEDAAVVAREWLETWPKDRPTSIPGSTGKREAFLPVPESAISTPGWRGVYGVVEKKDGTLVVEKFMYPDRKPSARESLPWCRLYASYNPNDKSGGGQGQEYWKEKFRATVVQFLIEMEGESINEEG